MLHLNIGVYLQVLGIHSRATHNKATHNKKGCLPRATHKRLPTAGLPTARRDESVGCWRIRCSGRGLAGYGIGQAVGEMQQYANGDDNSADGQGDYADSGSTGEDLGGMDFGGGDFGGE